MRISMDTRSRKLHGGRGRPARSFGDREDCPLSPALYSSED